MNHAPDSIAVASALLPARKTNYFAGIFFALLLTLCVARAEGPDEDYLAIYGTIEQADALNASGHTNQAHAKYIEAQQALTVFQRANPSWGNTTVSYRVNYLAEKVKATSGDVIAPEKISTVAKKSGGSAAKSAVKLLSPGEEPRTVLRLHPTVGDKQTVDMTIKVAMDMGAAGNQMPAMDIPAMLMTMDVEVKDVSATGEITYEMVFSNATVATDTNIAPAMAGAMKSSLAGIRGMTGTGQMSSQGVVSKMEMKPPAGAEPQLSQTMDQMKDSFSSSAIALPEEAVGAGAKWEHKTRLKSQGMTIDQTVTYELVALDGDRVTLRSTITQNAANQKIESPAMPGMKVDLNKMTGTGTGSTTLDLGKAMPVAGTMDEKTEINMGMNIGQTKQAMDMKMKMHITLEAK